MTNLPFKLDFSRAAKPLTVGTDFSGAGAPEWALKQLGIPHEQVFACENNRFAIKTHQANYGATEMFTDINTRPFDRWSPLDLYIAGPPCQSWSLSGKQGGMEDERGQLFLKSIEFVAVNRPKVFTFENVKGLLSGKHKKYFRHFINLLAKSENGISNLFAYPGCLGYHVYWQILNSKDYGVPQNRERVYIVGFRDDDHTFRFPAPQQLTHSLADLLDSEVDEKYYLSEKQAEKLLKGLHHKGMQRSKVNPDIAATLQSPGNACGNYRGMNIVTVTGYETENHSQSGSVYNPEGIAPCVTAEHQPKIIGYSRSQDGKNATYHCKDISGTTSSTSEYLLEQPAPLNTHKKTAEKVAKCLRTTGRHSIDEVHAPTLVSHHQRIRRLTPRECFRLQGFGDEFRLVCSDTQLYKQAGNAMTATVLEALFKKILVNF